MLQHHPYLFSLCENGTADLLCTYYIGTYTWSWLASIKLMYGLSSFLLIRHEYCMLFIYFRCIFVALKSARNNQEEISTESCILTVLTLLVTNNYRV